MPGVAPSYCGGRQKGDNVQQGGDGGPPAPAFSLQSATRWPSQGMPSPLPLVSGPSLDSGGDNLWQRQRRADDDGDGSRWQRTVAMMAAAIATDNRWEDC
jgi:hypothetical protein